MTDSSSDRELLDRLADSFAARCRRGERPSPAEYAAQYPHLADEIRELFPTLVLMEELGPARGDPTGPFTAPEPEGPAPAQMGEYRLLREVGRGGMGIVYEAVQESLGRHVALKVLPFHGSLDPTHLERFRREARAAAGLHHTNIVPVFGVGEHGGVHYYAMQFIQGQSLDAVLKEMRRLRGHKAPPDGELTPRADLTCSLAQSMLTGQFRPADSPAPDAAVSLTVTAVVDPSDPSANGHSELTSGSGASYFRSVARVGVQVAEALAYAHRQRVLHRDIKPSNLLLDTHGTVWVTDFGLAKAEGTGELTTPGDIVGTVRYMAPERFAGRADAQSDIYGLGITLYEMLALRPAFGDADRARLMERVMHDEPPRLRQVAPEVPRDLETIVLKAIAKEPRDRYPSAEALAEDLRRFLSDRPIRARRTSRAERTWRWCRRNPAVASLLALSALLLLALAVGSTVAAVWLRRERNVAVANGEAAERAKKDAVVKLRGSYLDQARAGRWSGQVGRRFKSLEALANAAAIEPSLELRNEAIACLALPDLRVAKTIRSDRIAHSGAAAFDLTFERYAVSDSQGELTIFGVADGREILRLKGSGTHAWILRFSPDGRFLAAVYDQSGAVKLWDLGRREAVLTVRNPDFDFSPDGRRLAVRAAHTIDLYDLPSGKLARRIPGEGPSGCIAFDPAGRRLARWDPQSRQVVVQDLDGKVLGRFPSPGAWGLAWQPDGKLLAVACAGSGVLVWDVAAGRQQATCTERGADFRSIAFNRAGDLLATTGWDETLRLWDAWTGRLILTGPNTGSGVTLQFSRDDRLLAGGRAGAVLEFWEVARARECRTRHDRLIPTQEGQDASFSPDGRLLALICPEGVRLWDVKAQREAALLPQPAPRGVLFHPAGDALLVYGSAGLYRWPLTSSTGPLRVGPPRRLNAPSDLVWACLRPDGRGAVVVQRTPGQAVVLDLEGKARPVVLRGDFRIIRAALSPDGRWAVTSNLYERGEGIRVWDARTGQVVKRLPGKGNAVAAFSPDGRRLVTGTGPDFRCWEVGSWEAGPVLPRDHGGTLAGPLAFSPDGKLLAVAHSPTRVRLLDGSTLAELGTLAAPHPQRLHALHFNPDGSRLVAICANDVTQVWDLRAIRARLAKMRLDWDQPPYPPEGAAAGPLQIEVVPGTPGPPLLSQTPWPDPRAAALEAAERAIARNPRDAGAHYRRGLIRLQQGQFAAARADFSQTLSLEPGHPQAHHQRGHAHEGLGQPARAAQDFTAALEKHPDDAHLLECRGRCYRLLGEYPKAVADLKRALALKSALPDACNNLAWAYAMGPADLRAPEKALPLAERAVELAPGNWVHRRTLGLVQYRLGRYADARATLERSIETNPGGARAPELFFLALCQHHLGDAEQARDCYEKALRWQKERRDKLLPSQARELDGFRDEAEAALAVPPKK